jgi:hypothetical protein
VTALATDLEARLTDDPEVGRAALRRWLHEGVIRVDQSPAGPIAETELLPLMVLIDVLQSRNRAVRAARRLHHDPVEIADGQTTSRGAALAFPAARLSAHDEVRTHGVKVRRLVGVRSAIREHAGEAGPSRPAS